MIHTRVTNLVDQKEDEDKSTTDVVRFRENIDSVHDS